MYIPPFSFSGSLDRPGRSEETGGLDRTGELFSGANFALSDTFYHRKLEKSRKK